MPILGAVDVGSNTFRFWLAEIKGEGRVRELCSGRETVRLGGGLFQTGLLSEAAMDRAVQTLGRFRSEMERFSPERIAVVATSAVREAKNRNEFIRRVREKVGWDLEVISGEEEAWRTYLGVSLGLSAFLDDALLVDIGGGSSELARIRRGKLERSLSLGLGVVHLAERYLQSDPPVSSEISSLRREVEERLRKAIAEMAVDPTTELIGTAGTVTTLAALDLGMVEYDPERVNGHLLSQRAVEGWLGRLSTMPLAERRKLAVLEPGREDLIVAGAVVVATLMDLLGKKVLRVSEYGLREGILYHLYLSSGKH
jgi:exopolyphosphatase/guanosine-5'-triphosphate,3'-diphosphate pyrophosphatase